MVLSLDECMGVQPTAEVNGLTSKQEIDSGILEARFQLRHKLEGKIHLSMVHVKF